MDGYPRWREILQHRAIFSVLIELIVPTMPKAFAHTNNPWNVVAYLAGGVVAGIYWKVRERVSPNGPVSPA
jgi:membrane protease YdiL (CAAX protease family)